MKKVFRNPHYLFLALIIMVIVFLWAVWFSNLTLIKGVVLDGSISMVDKINLLWQLTGSITTNFTILSASYTVLIALLFGIYIAMLVYFLDRRVKEVKQSGAFTGFLGIVTGALGVWCAACGSFLVTGLWLIGAWWILAFLPFGGGEFALLGIWMIALAIYKIAQKIQNPTICKL